MMMNWEIINTTNMPSKRSGHLSFVYNSKMFIFGGINDKGRLNDFYYYDAIKDEWNEIDYKGDGPSRRMKISGNVYRNSGVLMFGGYSKEGKESDMYHFDLNSNKFHKIKPRNSPPSKRSAHSCFMKNGNLVLFGGIGAQKYNDMYKYNIRSNSWSVVHQKNNIGKRSSYGGFHLYKGKYYLACGLGAGKFNDCHCFDYNSSSWEKIQTSNNIISRGRHSVCLYDSKLWCYGGWIGKTKSDELLTLDLNTKRWTTINQRGNVKPSKLEAHSAVIINHKMFLFGGWNEKNNVINSFYSLDLNQNQQ